MATRAPERAHINAFIDADERRWLARLARENDRTLSAEIRVALWRHLERDERAGAG